MSSPQPRIVEVMLYGIQRRSILNKLEQCAKKPSCMFVPVVSKPHSKVARSPVPCLLGSFFVLRRQASSLIRSLRLLVKTMKDMPLSCQVDGDIVDFRKPLEALEKELLGHRKTVSDLPTFEESLETLDRVGIRVIGKSRKLAAEIIERYPEAGPHRRVVCT